jgi:hypothetical protein
MINEIVYEGNLSRVSPDEELIDEAERITGKRVR